MKKLVDNFILSLQNNSKSISKHTLYMLIIVLSYLLLLSCGDLQSKENNLPVSEKTQIGHGKYLVKIAGCNDCHTVGYPENNGNVPVENWLTGSPVGFKGPWGTSYASNLRLYVQNLTESQWIEMAHTRNGLPPMPWISLKDMSESDLTAMYKFIKSLGPSGKPAPTYVGPNQEPNTPYIIFEPLHMERLSQIQK